MVNDFFPTYKWFFQRQQEGSSKSISKQKNDNQKNKQQSRKLAERKGHLVV